MHFDDAAAGIVGALLCAAGVWDLRSGRVPAGLSAAAVAAGGAAALLAPDVTTALLGLAVTGPFLVAWVLTPGLIGGGDVKLMAAATLASGWPAAAAVALLALAVFLAATAWSTLRRRPSPTVFCASLAAAYLLVTALGVRL